MQEDFTLLSIPRNFPFRQGFQILISILLALAIVVSTVGTKDKVVAGISMAILSILFYIIFTSTEITSTGLNLDSTVYPPPPHLGLDGVSVENRSIGTMI